MSDNVKRILTAAACMVMGCALGVVVTVTGFGQNIGAASDEIQAGADKYTEIMDLVDQYFIGDDVDLTAVNDAMASGVISGLGDRWSYYVSAEDYQSYVENINNAYVGVGITISAQYDEDGNLLGYGVSDVTQGGPAEEAGVLSGDLLVQVDGTAVQDITLTETKNMVKGEEGTTVDLTFLRDGETITLTVERRSLTLVPATGQLLDGSIGYIAIDNFDAGCAETVEGLVEDLQAQGATALVFDVRNNPGGLKRELTDLLDYLLPEGIVFHTVNYAGEEEIVMSDSSCVDLPMAVLVNGDSYSAAEYFACALQEYGVGTVVGEKTCGKGYYQVGLSLSDGSCINLSIGKYYTPNGESLIDVGVTPDIELELSDEDAVKLARNTLEPQDDPQLQAAIQSVMP
jgi:carboxyl-terminal processing protease